MSIGGTANGKYVTGAKERKYGKEKERALDLWSITSVFPYNSYLFKLVVLIDIQCFK